MKDLAKGMLVVVLLFISISMTAQAYAQNANTPSSQSSSEDPTKSGFKVTICDGPELPPVTSDYVAANARSLVLKAYGLNAQGLKADGSPYIPCNFNGMMMQVQHLINIGIVLGVFAAIALFTYAGYLLMTGREQDRNKAKSIFPKIMWGFVIMLSSWFIVYQILNWLTGSDSGFTKLLGNP